MKKTSKKVIAVTLSASMLLGGSMTEHKHIGKIVGALMAAAVAFCLIVALFADRFVAVSGSSAATMEYKSTLFDTSEIMTVNIIMDEDQWQELLDNAISCLLYTSPSPRD